jgi:hypothetical protein
MDPTTKHMKVDNKQNIRKFYELVEHLQHLLDQSYTLTDSFINVQNLPGC